MFRTSVCASQEGRRTAACPHGYWRTYGGLRSGLIAQETTYKSALPRGFDEMMSGFIDQLSTYKATSQFKCGRDPILYTKRGGGAVRCMRSSRTNTVGSRLYFQQNADLRLFVHPWIMHRIDDCHQLTRTVGGSSPQCLSKLFLREFTGLLFTSSFG